MRRYFIFIFLTLTVMLFSYNHIYGDFGDISEKSSVVLDADGLSILYNKNMNKKIYPASTTKILTAILAIEKLNLDSNITVSKEALDNLPEGSSTMYLKAGEIVTVRDLLYGLLLPSGSDAALVLAEAVSGSQTNFVTLMNNKLKELGCLNTHFTNPHGYHDVNHYSTAYDMAIIMRYASQNETFRKIVETKSYIVKATNKTPEPRTLTSTDLMLNYDLDYTIGGKTGFTEEAGNVFISYSRAEGKNIICAVYDGSKNILNKTTRFKDVRMLLDNSFKNYNKTKILDKSTFNISYINKKDNKNYILGIDKDIYCLTDENKYIIQYNISDISIDNNTVTGKLNVDVKNDSWEFNNTYDIKLNEIQKDVNKDNDYTTAKYLLTLTILFVLLVLLFNIKNKNIKKRKRNKKKIRTVN